jgi:putative ABC transport system permease protein
VFARILLASLAARRMRLLLALLAVSLGVAVATALATLSLQVGDDLARTLRAAGPNFVIQPAGADWPIDLGGAEYRPARAGVSLPDTSVARLQDSFWRNALLGAAPELAAAATLDGEPVTLLGTWFARELPGKDGGWTVGVRALRPTWTVAGLWPREGADEVLLGRDLAARLDRHEGQWVEADIEGRSRRLRVSGVVTAGGLDDGRAWAPLEVVQALSARPAQADRVWLSALVKPGPRRPAPDPARDPAGYERFMCTPYPGNVARDLTARLTNTEVLPLAEVVAGEALVVSRLNFMLLMLALAALASATLGMVATTSATVVERRVEIGLLRSLGATSRQLATLLLGETLLVSLAGGAAGWLLGSLAAALVRGRTFGEGSIMEPVLLPLALSVALAVAFLGTLAPMRMALRLDPSTVLRGQP